MFLYNLKGRTLPGYLLVAVSILLGCAEADTGVAEAEHAWQIGPFQKYEGNPILTPQGETWQAKDVFNPAAWTDGETARLALASSDDLRTWQKHGLVFPERGWTKSGAILATPVDGQYWMYFGDTNIWAASSTDLLHWTVVEEPVLRPRPGHFDSRLVEPGPAPVLTDAGILLLYNAADSTLAYASGQALFDPADPTILLARSDTPFLTPTTILEQTGQVSNVVFIQGLVDFQGRSLLYFGMGDSGIGVAVHTPDGE